MQKHRRDKVLSLLRSDTEPAKLVELVESVIEPGSGEDTDVHDAVLFGSPDMQAILDAWILGKYAHAAGAKFARLPEEREQWPDGFVTHESGQENVEVTEALPPGRRRGDEYKIGFDKCRLTRGPEDWDRELSAMPGILTQAIEKKVSKQYSEPSVLVVYLNISLFHEKRRDEKCKSFIQEQRYYADSRFEDVYVLWLKELFKLKKSDEP